MQSLVCKSIARRVDQSVRALVWESLWELVQEKVRWRVRDLDVDFVCKPISRAIWDEVRGQ